MASNCPVLPRRGSRGRSGWHARPPVSQIRHRSKRASARWCSAEWTWSFSYGRAPGDRTALDDGETRV